MKKNNLRTPLSVVKGLGSAKDGVHHWWMQRITAIALVPLFIWFIFSLNHYIQAPYYSVYDWISSPFTTIMLSLLIFTTFFHAMLGIQVVIEDYIHQKYLKYTALIGSKFILIFIAVTCFYSLFKIAFGGS